MTRSMLFWMIYIFAILFGSYWHFNHGVEFFSAGMSLVEFILIGLLGWQSYGPALRS